MKRTLLIVLITALCMCLVSCGGQKDEVGIVIDFGENLEENGYEFGLLSDISISAGEDFGRAFSPEESQIEEQKIIYTFHLDKAAVEAEVLYVKAPSVHKIAGITPMKIKLEEAVIRNSDGEEWFEITKAKEDIGSTDVTFTSLNGDAPLNFMLLADGDTVPPFESDLVLNEQGQLTGSMRFKKWPIDDEGARLSIKSSLVSVGIDGEAFSCEGKTLVILE